eukprot:scaffold81701_cov49-Cyclotella_meneghiniana.AAC.2
MNRRLLLLLLCASTVLTHVCCDHSLTHGGLRSHSGDVLRSEAAELPNALNARNDVDGRKLSKSGKSHKAKKAKTKPPTLSPTNTVVPTGSPTLTDAIEDPETPTQSPTQSPTEDGTVEKPGNPTSNPTKRPPPSSMSPSLSPLASPTNPPSMSPSSNPSHSPSANPTANPSSSPSASPSKPPSMSPSLNPSRSPSASPTDKWDARIQFNGTDVGDRYGQSVGVSDYTIVVGAPHNDEIEKNSGAAYILQKNENSGGWEEIQKITASDAVENAGFGINVVLSEEVAVVVCSLGNGAAYVFEFDENDDKWVETDKLNDQNSVAVFGKTIVAGSYRNNAVHIFNKNENTGKWVEKQTLSKTGGYFGFSVGVSGNVIVVGAPSSNANIGSAYVYEYSYSSGLWDQMGELSPKDNKGVLHFGWSVAVYENIIVIGAPYSNSGIGSAYIFEKNITGSWVEVKRLVAPDDIQDSRFGYSVGVFGDYAAIGCFRFCGSAYSFQRDLNGNWDEIPKKLQTANGDGVSVGISGNAIAIGSPKYNSDTNGAVFIFE